MGMQYVVAVIIPLLRILALVTIVITKVVHMIFEKNKNPIPHKALGESLCMS
jgi:hypothetical protein